MRFHKKIFFGYFLIFIVMIVTIFPLSELLVRKIGIESLQNNAQEIVTELQKKEDIQQCIHDLKQQELTLFFRVSILDSTGEMLYDSHASRIIAEKNVDTSSMQRTTQHPEVAQALQKDWGYHEEYSKLLNQELIYLAKRFFFKDKLYVLRVAFSLQQTHTLLKWFQFGFILMSGVLLGLFALFSSLSTYHFTQPIRRIIRLIQPYYQGQQTHLPSIPMQARVSQDEFDQLAYTINQLSSKVQQQINSLTYERNEKNAILEALIEGVVAIDAEQNITYVNTAALSMFGKLRHEMMQQPFEALEEKECQHLLTEAQKMQSVVSEMLYLHAGGYSARFFHISAVPLPTKTGAVLILHDQSEHYKILQIHKDFIANASHELKTPVTIIQGFAETLHQMTDVSKEKIHFITEKILRHTERINQLITSLLTLSNIENKQLTRKQDCDLMSIARRCQEVLLHSYPDAQISIQADKEKSSYIIQGEPQLLELALMNLIDNGIKYSPPPAEVHVHLGHNKIEKYTWINIEDHGIGVPEEDIGHIFERFYRVERARSRKMGGSGLGLSIVQMAVNKHGGTINVKSVPGQGTIFSLRFY